MSNRALEEMKIVQEIIGRQEEMRFKFRTMCLTIIAAAFGLVSLAQFDASGSLFLHLFVLSLIILVAFWLIEVLYHPPFDAALGRQAEIEDYFQTRGTQQPTPYVGPDFSKRLVKAAEWDTTTLLAKFVAGLKDGRIWQFYVVSIGLVAIATIILGFMPRRSDAVNPSISTDLDVAQDLRDIRTKLESLEKSTSTIARSIQHATRRAKVSLTEFKASLGKLAESHKAHAASSEHKLELLLLEIGKLSSAAAHAGGSTADVGSSVFAWVNLILKFVEVLQPSPPAQTIVPLPVINVEVDNSQIALTEIRSHIEILQKSVHELAGKLEEACRPPAGSSTSQRSNGRLRVLPGR